MARPFCRHHHLVYGLEQLWPDSSAGITNIVYGFMRLWPYASAGITSIDMAVCSYGPTLPHASPMWFMQLWPHSSAGITAHMSARASQHMPARMSARTAQARPAALPAPPMPKIAHRAPGTKLDTEPDTELGTALATAPGIAPDTRKRAQLAAPPAPPRMERPAPPRTEAATPAQPAVPRRRRLRREVHRWSLRKGRRIHVVMARMMIPASYGYVLI